MAKGIDMIHKTIGEKPVGEKGVVRSVYQQAVAVIVGVIDGFGVIGILINSLPHMAFDHIMESLEYIPKKDIRLFPGHDHKVLIGYGEAMFPFPYLPVECGNDLFNGFHEADSSYSITLESFRFSMV
jgi:hypothetical protein